MTSGRDRSPKQASMDDQEDMLARVDQVIPGKLQAAALAVAAGSEIRCTAAVWGDR